jgi:hypothetical protein
MDEKTLKKLDAASIVGDEFAQHLEEKTEELMVGRSTDGGALVIKNKDEDEEEMMMTEEDKKKKKEEMAEEAQKSLANYGGAKTLEEAEVFLAANPAMVTTPVDVLATVLGNAIGATAEQVEVARSVLSDYQDSLNVKTAESLLAIRQFLEGGQTMTDLVVKVAPDGEATQTEGVEEGATEVQPDAQTQPDALDVALSGFRQRMDEVGKSGASPQDQLMALQEGFEQFVEESALAVKSTVMPGQSNADGGITMADVQRAIRTELAPFLAALQPAAPAPAAQNGIVKRALAPTQDVKVENPVPAEEINRSGGNANQPKSVRDIARASVGLRR